MRTQGVRDKDEPAVSMGGHFARVSSRYRQLRLTDVEPVLDIRRRLPGGPLTGVDVGAGTGRYTALLSRMLGPRATVHALDRSLDMLGTLTGYADTAGGAASCEAGHLPMATGSVEFLTTFNAIHHFDLDRFVAEAVRVLEPAGQLFIYTRTPEQNAQSIWGRAFPGFTSREDRLLDLIDLCRGLRGLGAVEVLTYRYRRRATPAQLEERARGGAYSTFALYSPAELEQALAQFRAALGPVETVTWDDHNTLVHLSTGRGGRWSAPVAP